MTGWKGTIVFFLMDALGHVHPVLSLVKELERRKYRAIILTARPLNGGERLKAMGFELDHCMEKSGRLVETISSEEAQRATLQPQLERFRQGCAQAYEGVYQLDGSLGKNLDDMIEYHKLIETKLASLKPNLILYDHVIGIPCVTRVAKRWVRIYSGFPSALYSALNENCVAGLGLRPDEMTAEWKDFEHKTKRSLRQKLREFWAAEGAPDWPLELDLTPTSPYLNFYFGPRELGLEQLSLFKPLSEPLWFRLEHTIDANDLSAQISDTFKVPEKLAECPGKLIYFSLGTLITCDVELINRLLAILSKSPNKFIVSMGQMHERIHLYDNMWGERFLDQKAVLKHVDLFITHGGHNSIMEAFFYGVPGLIVLPVFADQFDSAQRIQDTGFGCRLNPYHCSEEALLEAIQRVLSDQELAKQMRNASERLKSIRYHEIAADKLLALIED